MSNVTAGVATYPEQFVGYWGCGNQATLSPMLKMACQVGGTNSYTLSYPTADGTLIELSAAGWQSHQHNNTSSDAWVKIEGNCLTLGRQAFGRVTLYWMQIEQVSTPG